MFITSINNLILLTVFSTIFFLFDYLFALFSGIRKSLINSVKARVSDNAFIKKCSSWARGGFFAEKNLKSKN